MKAIGWFLALFTFWMALLLTGAETLSTKGASGQGKDGGFVQGLEKGKSYVFRFRELPSGNGTENTPEADRGAEAEYHVLVDDVVPGRDTTLIVSLQAQHPSTYRIIVGTDGRVKDVLTVDVADAARADAARIRELRAGFESLLVPGEAVPAGGHAGEREPAQASRS
jgi:hypothetical protein